MKKIKTIEDIELFEKRILMRVDFNVALDGDQKITDDTRINAALPTIEYLLKHECRLILCSHLGRPKGKRNSKLSLKPIAADLAAKIGRPVIFLNDCTGDGVKEAVQLMKAGSVILLENLRFHPGEEQNDTDFSRELAELGDIYVNDAFGASHRAHASISEVPTLMPVKVAGYLLEKEIHYLGEKTRDPKRPYVVILGGAKVSDKIKAINSFLKRADTILIGGAMAYTFKRAIGKNIGDSPWEADKIEIAEIIMEKANKEGIKFLLPIDNFVTDTLNFEEKEVGKIDIVLEDIPDGWEGVDIGPQSVNLFSTEIANASTILWNGPMGIFEIDGCNKGTFAIAKAISLNKNATSIIGGGDSAKAINQSGYADEVSFISTGGGAALEFLEGKVMPGLSVLDRNQ